MEMEIQHFSHEHALTFFEGSSRHKLKDLLRSRKIPELLEREEISNIFDYLSHFDDEEIEIPKCSCCNQVLDDDGGNYFCETCLHFWLHKSCSLLPHELQHHPLHSSHPLTLIAKPVGPENGYIFDYNPQLAYFICDECRDLCPGNAYHCAECQFYLDVKCALFITDHNTDQHHYHHQRSNSRQLLNTKPHEMYHPSHIHQLIFFNSTDKLLYLECHGCKMKLQGVAYGCFDCKHFLHKSCAEMPQEIQQHPHHPQHPLLFHYDEDGRSSFICDGCRIISSGCAFQCKHCKIKLDVECALLTDGSSGQRSEECEIKTQIFHFSHRHRLLLFNTGKKEPDLRCRACLLMISGLGYGCPECKLYLHKSCAEMPPEIQHSYHPSHPLHAKMGDFAKENCAACKKNLCGDIVYNCSECDFSLHLLCAKVSRLLAPRLKHNRHNHSLYYFVGKSVDEVGREFEGDYWTSTLLEYDLQKLISGAGFEAPDINSFGNSFRDYNAESEREKSVEEFYGQQHINQTYDFDKMLNSIVDESDSDLDEQQIQRLLVCSDLDKPQIQHVLVCNVCRKRCDGPIYICLECECDFHLECIPIPQAVFKRDLHMHPLTLREPLVAAEDENNSKEYYCFACERERNPKYHAYYCDQCPYEAHIECMVSEFVDEEYHNFAQTSNNVAEVKGVAEYSPIFEYAVPRCRKQLEIGDFRNNHSMKFHEIYFLKQCYGCKMEFLGPAYTCEFCNINFHIVCAELPPEIRHTLHSLHPLKFFKAMSPDEYFICDGCATISRDCGYYRCEDCTFILDIECASIKGKRQVLEERHDNAMIPHFSHRHKLLLANCPKAIRAECPVCLKNISGPTYCCLECQFFIHESCSKVEKVIHKNPFHPQHFLELTDPPLDSRCKACNLPYGDTFAYCCSKCSFSIHYTCSKYLSSALKYKNHEHSLFYFVGKDLRNMNLIPRSSMDRKVPKFLCKVCRNGCNESFYRCLECDLNLHLQCMALPQKVKGAFHMHPVTLMDSVVQDCWEEQYCYYCEDVRNPDHAVYSCEECVYIAHIGCVLSEVDDSLGIFSSSVAFPRSKNLEIEFTETAQRVDWGVSYVPLYGWPITSLKNKNKKTERENKKQLLEIVEINKAIELLEQGMKSLKSS